MKLFLSFLLILLYATCQSQVKADTLYYKFSNQNRVHFLGDTVGVPHSTVYDTIPGYLALFAINDNLHLLYVHRGYIIFQGEQYHYGAASYFIAEPVQSGFTDRFYHSYPFEQRLFNFTLDRPTIIKPFYQQR